MIIYTGLCTDQMRYNFSTLITNSASVEKLRDAQYHFEIRHVHSPKVVPSRHHTSCTSFLTNVPFLF